MSYFFFEYAFFVELEVRFRIAVCVLFSDIVRFESVDFVEVDVDILRLQSIPSILRLSASIVIANADDLLISICHS